jgi:hypothetical protein
MSIKKHLILFTICFVAWLVFLIIGLPSNYYTEWSQAEKILLLFITYFSFFPIASFIILKLLGGDYFKNSFLLAFYATILIFFLDFLYCGIYQGLGLSFLVSHWPQTTGYIVPWFEIPFVGYLMKKWSSNVA